MNNFCRIKREIKDSFDLVHSTYDDRSKVQKLCGKELIKNLLIFYKKEYQNVIDLGCGTGITTSMLFEKIKFNKSYACDFAPNVINLAQNRIKKFSTKILNSDYYIILNKNLKYYLVFSNMSFQWCLDIKHLLKLIYTNLKYYGILSFSIPIKGTFQNIPSQSKNNFYNLEYLKKLIQNIGYKIIFIKDINYEQQFPSFIDAIRSIKNTGANILINSNKNNFFNKKLAKNKFTLNYNIGFFILQKC